MSQSIRISLPDMVRGKDSKIHPFPFQIAAQTLEFMQGTLFHALLVDIASGAYVRLPDGMSNLERIIINKLDSPKTYDEAWWILGKYQAVFETIPFQSVLIAMNSHWDWYVRKLTNFISFARRDLNHQALEKHDEHRLHRFTLLPIGEQLEVIRVAAGIKLTLTAEELEELQEMALVRNLGLHNRWEIDKRYLERTIRSDYQQGELRIIDKEELNRWHQIFHKIVQTTGIEVALAFVDANDFSD